MKLEFDILTDGEWDLLNQVQLDNFAATSPPEIDHDVLQDRRPGTRLPTTKGTGDCLQWQRSGSESP